MMLGVYAIRNGHHGKPSSARTEGCAERVGSGKRRKNSAMIKDPEMDWLGLAEIVNGQSRNDGVSIISNARVIMVVGQLGNLARITRAEHEKCYVDRVLERSTGSNLRTCSACSTAKIGNAKSARSLLLSEHRTGAKVTSRALTTITRQIKYAVSYVAIVTAGLVFWAMTMCDFTELRPTYKRT